MHAFWRKCRTTFRWCRFSVWLLILLVLCVGVRLNRVGLPDFLKQRLVAALNESGVQLEFSRMRLSLVRGVVADNVRVGGDAKNSGNLAMTAREVQLQLDFTALLHRRLQLDGLVVRDGEFTFAASPSNSLTLTNIQTDLRIGTNDTWTLDHFHAGFSGTQITISGEVAHAPEIADWKLFSGKKSADHGLLAQPLQQFSDTFAQIHFTGQPFVSLTVNGDARDVHSFVLRLDSTASGMRTPWFSTRDLQLAAQLTAPADAPTNCDPAWGFWTNAQPFQLIWTAKVTDLKTKKMSADTLKLGGEWRAPNLAVKTFFVQLGAGKFDSAARLDVGARIVSFTNDSNFDPHQLAGWLPENARAPLGKILWTQLPVLDAAGSLVLPSWTNRPPDDWVAAINPTVRMSGEFAFTNAVAAGATVGFAQTHFSYANEKLAAELSLANVSGREGQLDFARAHLNYDGQKLDGELTATNATARGVKLNSTQIHFNYAERKWDGEIAVTNAQVLAAPLDSAWTHFSYAGRILNLPDLELAQGRTKLALAGTISDATENFHCRLRGDFDPESVRPFLTTTNAVRGFERLKFQGPLVFHVDTMGNLNDLGTLTATGSVALTNFSIRAQAMDSVAGDFFYTNRQLEFFHPQLFRAGGTQMMQADRVTMDLVHGRIYFTNGFSTADPMAIVRSIGPKTARLIEPYHFLSLPTATVNGCSPMRDVNGGHDLDDADLTFVITKPVPFQWEKLRSPAMTGTIHWLGQKLVLTNIVAEVYGGHGHGHAYFDFTPAHPGADFQFLIAVTNVDLHLLAADLSSPTNKLEGTVAGELVVTNASSETWRSWNGYGGVQLRNGLLWNIPVFGLASSALNLFSPGLGNSRATDAAARFGLTNGVIYSDQLEMHTATMRLRYAGTLDLQQNVNARVTAQLLRNTPLLGPLVSLVLSPVGKIFECQVTGQLSDPKVTPIWVPTPITDVLLMPLHPIRSVEEMFSPATTNSPAQ
jgi:hypothetical protein